MLDGSWARSRRTSLGDTARLVHGVVARVLVGVGYVALATAAAGKVRLPIVISSHMVLQRGIAVPIWGDAEPAERVTVTFRDQQKVVTADAQGKWMVKLDPLQPGETATLSVSGTNTLKLVDVVVGEVWVGSGQSNMDNPVSVHAGQDPVLKAAATESHPQLRLCHMNRSNGWSEASPENVNLFSAQLFYYGVLLQKELNLPVGLMQAAQGGAPSSPFIGQDGFNADPDIQAALAKWDEEHPADTEQKKYVEALGKWQKDVAATTAATSPLIDPSNNSTGHPTPEAISKAILAKYPKPQPPVRAVETKTGAIFDRIVRPMIPYAIRGVLWDQGESGTGVPAVGQPLLMSALIRSWRKDWGEGDFPWIYVQKPSGGGDAFDPANPVNVGARAFGPLPKDPPTSFATTHVEGYAIMKLPNTFLTITTDLAPGIHPPNKSGYASRDCMVALGAVYGMPIEYYGPIFQSCQVEGDRIRINYTHAGKGLTVPANQKLQGFAIAGEDQRFHWADATVDGVTVVLAAPEVPKPVAVRYWPFAWANLFNRDGLPASGFRTDSWKR